MITIYQAHAGNHIQPRIEQHSDSNFFHESANHHKGGYSNHHYPENDFFHPAFEDEYDSYNSDFDLDTK